jgi:hypothetical protein
MNYTRRRIALMFPLAVATSMAKAQNPASSKEVESFDSLESLSAIAEPQYSEGLAPTDSEAIGTLLLNKKAIEKSATGNISPLFSRISGVDFGALMVDYALSSPLYKDLSRAEGGAPIITELLALLGLPYQYKETKKYVPFCAAGLVHLACATYSKHYGNTELLSLLSPTASVEKRRMMFDVLLPTIREHYFYPSRLLKKSTKHLTCGLC